MTAGLHCPACDSRCPRREFETIAERAWLGAKVARIVQHQCGAVIVIVVKERRILEEAGL